MHGHRVPSNEESSKVNSGEVVQSGVEAGELADIVTYHVQQALSHVFLGEL